MSDTVTLVAVIAALGAGTYALRLGGVLLATRVSAHTQEAGKPSRLGAIVTRLLPYMSVALLAALAATAAVVEAGRFAGIARSAGVLAGLVAGLLRAPFAVAVLLAAGVAAGLRVLGVE